MRQVSTSNDVYITQPDMRDNHVTSGLSQLGVEAVAKCSSTIELQQASNPPAVAHLCALLPVYTLTGLNSTTAPEKTQVFANMPCSEAECEAAWRELACFEILPGPGGCFIPSAKLRRHVWNSMLTAGTANDVDWTRAIGDEELAAMFGEEDVEWPSDLSTSVLRAMSDSALEGDIHINARKCVRFVGLSELEAEAASSPVSKAAFITAWEDSLPEVWRGMARLVLLHDHYALADGDLKIQWVGSELDAGTGATVTAPGVGQSAAGAKRKDWHELFRPSKKGG